MPSLSRLISKTIALVALGISAGAVSPLVIEAPATAQITAPATAPAQDARFADVRGYWARPFIEGLAARNIITGYPDGQFRPDQPVQRAEFATMIQKAFNQPQIRQLTGRAFIDVPADYWASLAIEEAYETGFMNGYPGRLFYPNRGITKAEAIVALSNGLNLSANASPTTVLNTTYADSGLIPNYGIGPIAAATQENIVVNYPNVRMLGPNQVLTRGEAAALIYQALVHRGALPPISNQEAASNYIVTPTAAAANPN